jgi:hypothetical protein
MIEGNEVVMLLIGFGVLVFLYKNRLNPPDIPAYKILSASFYVLFIGLLTTVVEGLFLNTFLNYVEHICYAISSILMAVWCGCLAMRKEV